MVRFLFPFSIKSRGRLRFVAANSKDIIKTQFCMTYMVAYGRSKPLSYQRSQAVPNMAYIWIAEFQTRDCPHFHLFSSIELMGDLGNGSYLCKCLDKIFLLDGGVCVDIHAREIDQTTRRPDDQTTINIMKEFYLELLRQS